MYLMKEVRSYNLHICKYRVCQNNVRTSEMREVKRRFHSQLILNRLCCANFVLAHPTYMKNQKEEQ